MSLGLSTAGCCLIHRKFLDKGDHLVLFNHTIAICVHFKERLIKPCIVVVVWWWAVTEDDLQEGSRLILVQLSAIVRVESKPYLVDCISVEAV